MSKEKIKKSPMRLLGFLPVVILLAWAGYYLMFGDSFTAIILFFLAFFGLLFAIPITGIINIKIIPVLQIMFSFIFVICIFAVSFYYDYYFGGGVPQPQAILFAGSSSLLATFIMMLIIGKLFQ